MEPSEFVDEYWFDDDDRRASTEFSQLFSRRLLDQLSRPESGPLTRLIERLRR